VRFFSAGQTTDDTADTDQNMEARHNAAPPRKIEHDAAPSGKVVHLL
jgi:hypothetical protein